MDHFKEAQSNMRDSYGNGSVGIFVSGIIWLLSCAVVNLYTPQKAIWFLMIGGVFIFPLSLLIGKLAGIKGEHQKTNPLGKLAMEGTIWMIMCIPLAYGLSLQKAEWFFQGMLMIIAGRYLTFASIYGISVYWMLGAVLGLSAFALFSTGAGTFLSAFAGGFVETVFGVMIYLFYRRDKQKELKGHQ
ncbi:hypothetical protein ACM46_18740 [Chryseobacterium angstadtii]|uniref:Uncharacterized protein n=1 Tax=Chryseobacterium angstadtii TaxID=558151 RepID=A0A0J7I1E4_9FLAO|nr:hypothetical protein [Chryseobacterium angstadtii]KMQ60248.1 hypothetical protein ACM46_18740 [Chryseobacterium angstadtii]